MEKKRLVIKEEQVKELYHSDYISLYDLQYEEGRHYFDISRRPKSGVSAIQSDEEFKNCVPDAVTCFVILRKKGEEPKLLLSNEYRYPVGRFILSPPAGLMDREDRLLEDPIITCAKREIGEETGIRIGENDKVFVVSETLFSSPGMSDESNAIVCAVVDVDDYSVVNQSGAVGTEMFDGYELIGEEKAKEILRRGKDDKGLFFSVYTSLALLYFVSGLWKEKL